MTPAQLSAVIKPLVDAIDRSNAKDTLDYFAGFLTALSFLLVAWSTVLTKKMQKAADRQTNASIESLREAVLQRQQGERTLEEARRQNQLAVRPFLAVMVSKGDHQSDVPFAIQNVGNGVALNVQMDPMEYGGTTVTFVPISLIKTNTAEVPMMIRYNSGDTNAFPDDACQTSSSQLMAIFHDPMAVVETPIKITYSDLFGNCYITPLVLTIAHFVGDWEIKHGGQSERGFER